MLKVCIKWLMPVIWLAAAQIAAASTFDISPIRAELSGQHRIQALTLTNVDDAPVVIQMRLVRWSQENGADRLEDTRDLLAAPPVMQIPAHGEQIIRVALRRAPDPSRELSYRVIFQEVPRAAPKNFMGLRIALRLSVPVFVAPAHGKAHARLAWSAQWLPGGKLRLSAANRGTGHIQVTDFALRFGASPLPATGISAKYVLPGSTMSWTLTPPAGVDHHAAVSIHGHSDQGDFSANVAIHAR
ncbi:MAG: molecular chaperone [Steroidobacteraceae bacterium]|nr:molecular chaperone [Steroidobacteraceae bacterium]